MYVLSLLIFSKFWTPTIQYGGNFVVIYVQYLVKACLRLEMFKKSEIKNRKTKNDQMSCASTTVDQK